MVMKTHRLLSLKMAGLPHGHCNFKKWRVYFNVPEPLPPTSVNAEIEPQHEPGEEDTLNDTTVCKGKKRTSEDAGFELN